MNLEFKDQLPEDFAPNSRVWIYQSSRLFSLGEALQIEEQINEFCKQWNAHGASVKGYGNLFFGQFLVLIADETAVTVSGCSTDSSVRFVKLLEQQYRVNFFDRQSLAFVIKDKVQVLPLAQLQYAFDNGFINADTIYFNNLVQTKQQLEEAWLQPVKQSWLAQRLKLPQTS